MWDYQKQLIKEQQEVIRECWSDLLERQSIAEGWCRKRGVELVYVSNNGIYYRYRQNGEYSKPIYISKEGLVIV